MTMELPTALLTQAKTIAVFNKNVLYKWGFMGGYFALNGGAVNHYLV
ncbi:hypothetical protein HG534_09075 [Moraxella osloensis]|nr:hypothetical protein [Moraxella osloensis]MBW4016450.1 hypothetical protein [Moraxella osloensis]